MADLTGALLLLYSAVPRIFFVFLCYSFNVYSLHHQVEKRLLPLMLIYVFAVAGLLVPSIFGSSSILNRNKSLPRETFCENTATSRSCWGEYNIDTDYYDVVPDTGVTREYWLTAQNIMAAPDGFLRQIFTFNGTVPGPTIEANWGDNVIIHVKNELSNNGTAVHWHGIRQLNNNDNDGVPGVTQCPIAPGETMTYRFLAQQYGTTWYHSHFSVQTIDGLAGPIIIHGPATADYDEHLGALFLSDWDHDTASKKWKNVEKFGGFPIIPNGIINGTNTFDCTGSADSSCLGTGKRFEITFVSGKKYRIGLVGTQADGFLRFSIDNHMLTVISTDLVPIIPYVTESLALGAGQRYDIIVEANQAMGNFWLRAIMESCNIIFNANADNIRGIVRYEGIANTTENPTTTSWKMPNDCHDQQLEKLVPYLRSNVGPAATEESLSLSWYFEPGTLIYHWTVNTRNLKIDWANPTLLMVKNGQSIFPTENNVYEITAANEWVYFIIQDLSLLDAFHPIHLHGHDFHIIAQGEGVFIPGITSINLQNPPRRDTAILPGNGYLVIAFYTDNPGIWLMHCHIIWHASQGFALQFVERESEISEANGSFENLNDTCTTWNEYVPNELYVQDDSGI